MRRYETIFISYAELPDEEITGLIERYSAIIRDRKGTVIKIEKWGKRKLAYEIGKQSRGFYVLIDFAGSSAIVTELERNLKIGDKILKYMTVKTKDAVTAEEIEQELLKRAEAVTGDAPAPVQEKPAIQENMPTTEGPEENRGAASSPSSPEPAEKKEE